MFRKCWLNFKEMIFSNEKRSREEELEIAFYGGASMVLEILNQASDPNVDEIIGTMILAQV